MTFRLISCTVLLACVASAASAAPNDPYVGAVVTAVPDKVTLQRNGLGPLAAYEVRLLNNAANVLNRVSFSGTALLTNGGATAPIAVDSVVAASSSSPGANCSIGGAGSSAVTCNVGSLAPRSSLVFYVVVKSPTAGEQITFGWTFSGAEGNSQTGNSFYTVSDVSTTRLTDSLATSGKKEARSFVPSATGLTLFTGASTGAANAVGSPATPEDPYTTTVVIPTGVTTTATIEETETAVLPCQVGACYQSQLTIPGTFAPQLIIYLRRDGSTTSGNIRNAVIYYTADEAGASPIQVAACDLTTSGPEIGKPCIKSRREFTRSNSPSPVEAWVKDWEFEIWALDNGRYSN